jgi:hypothetical protein
VCRAGLDQGIAELDALIEVPSSSIIEYADE